MVARRQLIAYEDDRDASSIYVIGTNGARNRILVRGDASNNYLFPQWQPLRRDAASMTG